MLNEIEGNYITNSILSKFNGVFIGDRDSIYKLYYDVSYGTNKRNQSIGTFEPLGKQFPVIVANGLLSYETGTVSATILNEGYDKNGILDRKATVQTKDVLKDFLTNRKAKILKDWNGNIWLCIVTGSPQVTYKTGSGMALANVGFNYVTLGDSNNQTDLYNSGIVEEAN